MASEKAKAAHVDLNLLEEDDEFEEFAYEDWVGNTRDDEDVNVWEDNWDDDNIEDNFCDELRKEISKTLADDKRKKTSADVASELKIREAQATHSQVQARHETDRKSRNQTKK